MKKIGWRIVQVVVTVAVLVWVFRDPELRANIPVVLHRARGPWIALGIACAGLAELSNIFRWQILLRVQDIHVPLPRTALVFMIGVFFNMFLFGTTGGDVVRAAYLCGEQKDRKAGVILSVVVDRLMGMLVLVPFGLLVVILRYRWFRQTASASALLWFLIVFMLVMVLFFAAAIWTTRLGSADRLPRFLTRVEWLKNLLEACAKLGRRRRDLAIAYALSVPVLFGTFTPFYCAARAFGAHASALDVYCLLPIVTLVTSLPISFSGVGVREQLFKNLLGDLAGVPGEVAVLISLTGFLSYVCWCLLGAVIYLFSKPGRSAAEPELTARSGASPPPMAG